MQLSRNSKNNGDNIRNVGVNQPRDSERKVSRCCTVQTAEPTKGFFDILHDIESPAVARCWHSVYDCRDGAEQRSTQQFTFSLDGMAVAGCNGEIIDLTGEFTASFT